ncbi:pentatricopeptide repeat-containing protein [Canna indica]|uniref:Pentatricopeptide repeat-containing protein n=1 Tax=Canna indica TaxID=4628 RepID=A0AAQ3JNJ6_9LILI|nr:pentatricopeptide repeat-containing protein [Canna indica]
MSPPALRFRALSTLISRRPKKRLPFPSNKPLQPKPPPPEYMRTNIHKITTILRYSPWDTATAELRELPIRWDSFTVNRVLKTHPPMEKAWLFFHWAARLPGFKHDQFTYTTMLDIFGEAGRIPSMWRVFREMEDKGVTADAATYTSVMHWLSKAGDLEGAERAWEEMRARGYRPTLVSYTAFMKILFDHGKPKEAASVYREMLDIGLSPNCHTYTVLMEHLAGAGKFKAALEIMNEMQEAGVEPDKAACNILIKKCSKAGETSAMRQILQYMKDHSIVLRHSVFKEALEAFKLKNENDHLLREVNPHISCESFEDELYFQTTSDASSFIDRGIIINLLATQNLIAVEHILNGMVSKHIELDTKLISTIVQVSCAYYRPSCALMVFHYCLQVRKQLDRSTYICLLGFFIRDSSFKIVMEIVHEMIKAEICFGTYLVYLLIYRLSCAGLYTYAENIFYSLPMDQNIVTCTALMDSFFRAGEIDKVYELYSKLKTQDVPISAGTYEVLILGLERAGRVGDAEVCKKERKKYLENRDSKERISLNEILCNYLFNGASS